MKTLDFRLYKNNLFIFFLVIAFILCSGHALITIDLKIRNLNFLFALVFSIQMIYVIYNNKLSLLTLLPILFVIMIFFTAYVNNESLISYLMIFSIITFSFGIVTKYEFKKFVDIFLKIMTVISCIAIIGYLLLQYTTLMDYLPKIQNRNGIIYGVGIIFNYIPVIKERNCGIFWEPGLFASFLIFSIIFELIFKTEKESYFRLIIFSISIFTANSSAGFLLWIFCVFLYLVSRAKKKFKNPVLYVLSIIGFCICVLLVLNLDQIILKTNLSNNPYFQKLLSDNIESSSRMNAFWYNLKLFFQHPFFGIGITNYSYEVQYVADTSTSTYFLSVFGILGSIYTISFVYGILKVEEENILTKLILILIILFILNKEPHINILFSWCFLFYLLKNTLIKKDNL